MNALFLNLLRTSLVVGAVCVVLTLLRPLWNRRYGALWKKRLWCLLAALALIGVFVQLPEGTARVEVTVPEWQVVVTRGENAGGPRVSVIDPEQPEWENVQSVLNIDTSKGTAFPSAAKRVPSLSLLTVGEIFWVLGAAAFLLRLAEGELLFRRRLRRWAKPAQSQILTALYERLCSDLPKAHFPKLLVCPGIGSPLLTGVFRPKLLLPTEDYPETEAAYILRHELAHWRSGDLLWKLLLLSANAVHWFNPAIWLLRREANRDVERACDEIVMRGAGGAERRIYSEILLSSVRKGRQPAMSTYFYGGAKVIKERLTGILSGNKRRGAALAVACAALAICMVPLVSCSQTSAENSAANKTAEWSDIMVSYFHADEQQTMKLNDACDFPAAKATDEGATVTILQTLADRHCLYIAYEVQLPEPVLDSTLITWKGHGIYLKSDENETTGFNTYGTTCYEVDGNVITGLYYAERTQPLDSNNSILYLSLHDLGYFENDSGAWTELFPGTFELSWKLRFNDTTTRYEINQKVEGTDQTVDTIDLSPLSVWAKISGSTGADGLKPIVEFQDKSVIDTSGLSTLCINDTDFSGAGITGGTIGYAFDAIVDVDAVKSVLVKGQRIGLTTSTDSTT